MTLLQVKKGFALHYPENMSAPDARYRGGPGYVVDGDAPGEIKLLKGQRHKLEPAPEGATTSPIKNPAAARLLKEEAAKAAPAAAADAPPEKPSPFGDLPKVELPSTKAVAAK